MRYRPGAILILCTLLGLPCARAKADAAATPPSGGNSKDAMGEDVVADTFQAVAQWRRFPLLPKRSISQVVHFSENSGLLVADWPILDAGPVSGRVPLTDLPGDAIIMSHASPRQHVTGWPMFEYYEVSSSTLTGHHLQVLNTPLQLQVIQDIKTPSSLTTISLIESLDISGEDPVTLRVQKIQGTDPAPSLAISARTMPDLRREHPREFEQYLRPLFQQFHQDQAIFAVEDQVAWQVMSDVWQPPPDLASQLAPLIAQLDAGEYSQRERAQAALRQIGQPAALYLASTDRRTWSAEQKARTDKLIAGFFPLTPQQAEALGKDVNFLLDCLTTDDAALRIATLKHLNCALGREVQLDIQGSPAQRLASIAQLRKQLSATTRDSTK